MSINKLIIAVSLALLLLLVPSAMGQAVAVCPISGGETCGDGNCETLEAGLLGCACASGMSGSDCSVPTTCEPALFATVDALETDNIPTQVTADYTNDALTIEIDSPLVAERRFTTVWVDDSVPSHSKCGYPGDYWIRSHDEVDCHDVFTGVMPWAVQTATCGWDFDAVSDEEYFVYTADMIVQHHDFIDPFGGRGAGELERLTQHIIPLEVRFQKYVDVSTEITISSDVTLLAAITKQVVDAETKIAVIEVTTNLLNPYKLRLPEIISTPDDPAYDEFTYSIEETGDAALCPDDGETSCTQQFTITIDASSGCEISGLYDLLFATGCQDPDNCDLDAGSVSELNLIILSEDFCAKVTVQVDISGVLESYESNAYSTLRSSFFYDQTSFFQADLDSPDATLTSSTIRTVKLVNSDDATDVILLYADGATLIADAAFALDVQGDNFAQFYFDMKESYMGALTADSTKSYNVAARVDVTFLGVEGVKRLTLAGEVNNKPMSLSSQIGVQASIDESAPANEEVGSSASTLQQSVLAIVVSAFVAFMW